MDAKELLEKLEWSGRTQGQGTSMGANNGAWYSSCPVCRGLKGKPNEFRASAWGHQQGCDLMEALLELRDRHPDDEAVDRWAAAMKNKLARKRVEGRGGWEDKETCSQAFLSELLHEHVEKGDPLDVSNLAMMLWDRGESVLKKGSPAGEEGRQETRAASSGTITEDATAAKSELLLFYEKLERHDWWYMMSDDGSVYERGEKADRALRREAASSEEKAQLHKAFSEFKAGKGTAPARPA